MSGRGAGDAGATGWVAGVASVPFPVPPGTPLAGYAARVGTATGTLDQLTVSALALAAEGERLTLIAADLVAVDAGLATAVAGLLGGGNGEGGPGGPLWLCASHTHAGPAGIVPRLHPSQPDQTDPALRHRFARACAEAASRAWGSAVPASLRVGRADAPGLAANRNDPAGPRDEAVTTLAAVDGSGRPVAVAVLFACHPTVLGAENLAVSADFPGALRRALGARLAAGGEPPVVLFVNGAAGDVSTRFTRRAQDAAEVERIGTALAAAAQRALDTPRPLAPALRHASATVALPAAPRDPGPDTRATGNAADPSVIPIVSRNPSSPPPGTRPDSSCRRNDGGAGAGGGEDGFFFLRRNDGEVERESGGEGRPAPERERRPGGAAVPLVAAERIQQTRRQGEALRAKLYPDRVAAAAEVAATSLGELALVAIPGELLAALGRRIVDRSPFPTTVVVGYVNGYVGYLVDRSVDGCYEALASPFGPEAGPAVAEAAVSLLARLRVGPGKG